MSEFQRNLIEVLRAQADELEAELDDRDASTVKRWEPSGGVYSLNSGNVIQNEQPDEVKRLNCVEFADRDEANRIGSLRKQWQTLAKYVSDHSPGYTPDREFKEPHDQSPSYVFHSEHSNDHRVGSWTNTRSPGFVLMPRWVAVKLAADLNSGRVRL